MSQPGPRPLIGVTTYRQTTSWWAWERDAALVPGLYLDMVVQAGGQPLLIPPVAGDDADVAAGVVATVEALDGLVSEALARNPDLEAAQAAVKVATRKAAGNRPSVCRSATTM